MASILNCLQGNSSGIHKSFNVKQVIFRPEIPLSHKRGPKKQEDFICNFLLQFVHFHGNPLKIQQLTVFFEPHIMNHCTYILLANMNINLIYAYST